MTKPDKQSQGGTADGSKSQRKSASKIPSAEEIAAKRAVRAAKKAEEEQKAKLKEEELRAAALGLREDDGGEALSKNEKGERLFVPRRWRDVSSAPRENDQAGPSRNERRVRVLSWNMLAQGLVRRKLFPGSDCLKMADREAGLSAELLAHRWDVGCFQEVDRTDIHFATLERGACAYQYEKGYHQKQHGLMIAWRTQPRLITDAQGNKRQGVAFQKDPVDSKIVYLDDVDAEAFLSDESKQKRRQARQGLSEAAEKAAKRAGSRQTRNIALMVALRFADEEDESAPEGGVSRSKGIIVATTHLFWHPMHAYERVRQAGIILRELDQFRKSRGEWKDWEIVLAGDFNDQPHSATYHFMTDQELTQHCMDEIKSSSVVHQTIDARVERDAAPTAPANGAPTPGIDGAQASQSEKGQAEAHDAEAADEEEGDEEVDGEGDGEEGGADDQILKNCRAARPGDGLFSISDIKELYTIPLNAGKHESSAKIDVAAPVQIQGVLSTYGAYNADDGNFFGSPGRGRERHDDPDWTPETPNPHEGASREPMWTIFSSLFSLTLDYVFLLPSPFKAIASASSGDAGEKIAAFPKVTALLPTHRTEVLEPGVPRKGVCCSDHIAIGAEIEM